MFDAVYLIPAIDYATSSKCKIILWMWNTIEEYNIKRIYLAKEFAEVWTFDKGDALKYGLHFSEQFYFVPSDTVSTITNKTIFFVGADKNRMKTICGLSTELTKIGYVSDFHVLPDSGRRYKPDEQVFLLKDRMDYFQVIDHVKNCSVVLDLVKEGQVGLTVRTLEAAFYGKKVITNNKAAKYYDLYKFGNIYILGDAENYKLENFLMAPFKEYPKEVLSEYTAQRWLDNLSSGKESELEIYGDIRHTGSKQASKQADILLLQHNNPYAIVLERQIFAEAIENEMLDVKCETKFKGIAAFLSKRKIQKFIGKNTANLILNRTVLMSYLKDAKKANKKPIILFLNSAFTEIRYPADALLYLKRAYDATFVLYYIDTISRGVSIYANYLRKKEVFDLIYTFDKDDAYKYELMFWETPYSKMRLNISSKFDLYFCGVDTDRIETIQTISRVPELDYSMDLIEVSGSGVFKRNNRIVLQRVKDVMPYKIVLEKTLEVNCILEIVRPGQVGFTLGVF